MRNKIKEKIPLILLIFMIYLTGCMTSNPDDQTVPWGRPADWERSTPYYGG